MAPHIPVKIVVIDFANECLCSPEMSSGLEARRAYGSVDNPGCLRPGRLLQSAVTCSRCCAAAPVFDDRQQEDCV